MANNLVAVAELSFNGQVLTAARTVLLLANKIRSVDELTQNINGSSITGASIQYDEGFGVFSNIFVFESVAAVEALLADTNSVTAITLTKIITTGSGAIGVSQALDHIVKIYQHPSDTNNSLVVYNDITTTTTSQMEVAEDLAAIQALSYTAPGGSTTLFYQLTEAQAIAALAGSGLATGALYQITLDGTSEGNTGDVLFVKAIDSFYFDTSMGYSDNTNSVLGTVRGVFDAGGFAFTAADPTLTADTITGYKFDTSVDELQLDGYTNTYLYGIVEIAITGSEILETITGGFEGMELMIFATGGNMNQIEVINTGNIILDNSTAGTAIIFDDNTSFFKVKKRGSNWIQTGWLNL